MTNRLLDAERYVNKKE